jgi:hypothetical protein
MGRLLVADVALGVIQSIVVKCRGKTHPPDHADSILVSAILSIKYVVYCISPVDTWTSDFRP